MKALILALLVAVLLAAIPGSSLAQAPGLVSYWPGNGNYLDVVGGNNGMPIGGVSFGPGIAGSAFTFDGASGRIFVPDSPSLAITGSIAMSAWVLCNGIPDDSFASQILFRGDDRDGLDPYSLVLYYNNYVDFHICNGPLTAEITGPITLGSWTFVAASLDDGTGEMQLFVDGEQVAMQHTGLRPLGLLDPNSNPGVGIGNVQSGNFNEYYDGSIEEVKLYNTPGPAPHPVEFLLQSNTARGGTSQNGAIVLDDTPFQTALVSLKSDNAAVVVPPTVQVGYGRSMSVPFTVKATHVFAPRTAHLKATLNGVSVTTTLTVTR